MRVDWGPSSVIFDDLLGLYYRTNRGIFGMAPKEQDREWCLAGKWSPESNDHRVYPSTISSWAMYSAGLGSYCHFILHMTVANDWRRRTRKFRSVVINWGVLLECVKCGKLFGRLMLLYVQAVDTRCRLVVGAAKVRLSESIQSSDVSPLSLDAESRVFWIVKGRMRWRFALRWHPHSYQWRSFLWNLSNRHVTKEKCKYGARDGKFDIITYFTLHFHKKPPSSSSPMT